MGSKLRGDSIRSFCVRDIILRVLPTLALISGPVRAEFIGPLTSSGGIDFSVKSVGADLRGCPCLGPPDNCLAQVMATRSLAALSELSNQSVVGSHSPPPRLLPRASSRSRIHWSLTQVNSVPASRNWSPRLSREGLGCCGTISSVDALGQRLCVGQRLPRPGHLHQHHQQPRDGRLLAFRLRDPRQPTRPFSSPRRSRALSQSTAK